MSGQHTQGRISLAPKKATYKIVLPDNATLDDRMRLEHLHASGLGRMECLSIGTVRGQVAIVPLDESSEANARRLVACWNAFEGYSTEVVEKCKVIIANAEAQVEARVLVPLKNAVAVTDLMQRELAAARQLLREVLDGSDAFPSAMECHHGLDGEAWAVKARSYLDACDTLGGEKYDTRTMPIRADYATLEDGPDGPRVSMVFSRPMFPARPVLRNDEESEGGHHD